MKYSKWAGIAVALLAAGCASVEYKEIDTMPEVRADEGLVYFFREKKFAGSAVSYYIYEDNRRIGALKNGTFFYVRAEPGTHTYTAKTEATETVTLEVEAGETYYIKGEVDMGFFAGRPDLTIVAAQEGQSEIPNLKYAVVEEAEVEVLAADEAPAEQ